MRPMLPSDYPFRLRPAQGELASQLGHTLALPSPEQPTDCKDLTRRYLSSRIRSTHTWRWRDQSPSRNRIPDVLRLGPHFEMLDIVATRLIASVHQDHAFRDRLACSDFIPATKQYGFYAVLPLGPEGSGILPRDLAVRKRHEIDATTTPGMGTTVRGRWSHSPSACRWRRWVG